MAEQNQGANEAGSPSALEAAIASSPEALQEGQQAQETQAPSAQQGETQEQEKQQTEELRVPYSRLKEVIDEKNWYKQQLERTIQQQPQQQFQQPTQDPYAGMTPEEEKFWRTQRQIAREEALRVSQEQLGQIKPVIDAGRMELAQMKVQQFRAEHPDVKPNSQEEMAIAEKIQMGYLPEDAYRSVMWDTKVASAEKQANQNIKQKIEAKKQANVEQRSIPSNAVLPTNQKIPLRERIQQEADKLDWS